MKLIKGGVGSLLKNVKIKKNINKGDFTEIPRIKSICRVFSFS